jgi:hypothetical protein
VVHTSDSFSKNVAHLKHFQLGASRLVFCLINSVGYHDLVERTGVDAIDRVAAQDAVGDERIHLVRTFLLQKLCSTGDGVRGIGKIVDEDRSAARDISDQHHGRVLSVVDLSGAAFLVNKSEGHAERIGNSGRTLRTTSVGTDHDGLLEVGNVELDVFAEEMTAVQIVHGDVEEALILRVCRLLARI